MSAAEKLKALELLYGTQTDDSPDLAAYINALPQIVALVEAAEAVHSRICGCEVPGGNDDGWVCFAGKELRALSALDEVLGDVT